MAYTTLDMVEAELKLSSGSISSTTTPSDTQVYDWITQAEDIINERTGNIYSQQLETSVKFDWTNNDNILRVEPFVSITSLWYNDQYAGDTPVWTLKTEDTDFYAYGDEGEIEFISSNFVPLSGKRRFMLTYTKGMSKVPARVKSVAAMMVANKVVNATVANQAYEQSGGAVQVGTISIDDPSAFSMSAYKQRDVEVQAFLKDVVGTFKAHRISREY